MKRVYEELPDVEYPADLTIKIETAVQAADEQRVQERFVALMGLLTEPGLKGAPGPTGRAALARYMGFLTDDLIAGRRP